MQKKALILHAWYSKPHHNWYPWLKEELEKKKYQVFTPELPTMNSNAPDMELQLKTIKQTLKMDSKTTVIGHSLGCILALRLAEREKYQKMILVAGWDFDDLTREHQSFWPDVINHSKIKKNVNKIYCVTSDNDPYMTAYQVEEMAKRLNGTYVLIKGAGHFSKKMNGVTQIPEILRYL